MTREEADDAIGICGCGDPDAVRARVVELMEAMQARHWQIFSYDNLDRMLVLTLLDKAGFLEHGSTIRCSWLTPLGIEVLAGLKAQA